MKRNQFNTDALQHDYNHDPKLLYWLLTLMAKIEANSGAWEDIYKQNKTLSAEVVRLREEVDVYKRIDKLEQRLLNQ